MPVLFVGREPDDVAGVNFFYRAAFVLGPAAAGGDDEGLAERVGVPRSACAGLERDVCASDECWIGSLEERIDADSAGEPVCGAFAGGLGADAFDVHRAI